MKKIEEALTRVKGDIIVLPELANRGYLYENKDEIRSYAESVPEGETVRSFLRLSKKYMRTLIFGLVEKDNDALYDTAVIVSKGVYIGKYRKIHLSDYEKNYFNSGEDNPVFVVDGIKIGAQICFDLWFPEISREQVLQGADILCVLANFGGEETKRIAPIRALENMTPLIMSNRVGREKTTFNEAYFRGESLIVDRFGKTLNAPRKDAEFAEVKEIEIAPKKGNVICRDLLQEMKRRLK